VRVLLSRDTTSIVVAPLSYHLVMTREQCVQCGFDSDVYDRADTISSQPIIHLLLRASIEGLPSDVLQQRPAADTWSIAEYIDHVGEVAFGNRFAIETALNESGAVLGEPPSPTVLSEAGAVDVDGALSAVETEYAALRALLASLDDAQWDLSATIDDEPTTVGWFARHVLHDGLHHLGDIGRIRHGFDLGAASETGVVEQINVSDGGVPKIPVESVKVSAAGVGGDKQNDRRHHGRPIQAVCLWSADVIQRLAAEGHPIAAGNAGENLTLRGIDWAALHPGSRIDVGEVPLLISAHAIPCAKNAQWFSDGDFKRILHERNPGLSRLYAIPLAPGTVAAGDPVVIEPDRTPPIVRSLCGLHNSDQLPVEPTMAR